MRLAAALLVLPVLTFALPEAGFAQEPHLAKQRVAKRNFAKLCRKPAFAQANPKTCAKYTSNKDAAPAQTAQPEQPTRPDFTQDDQNAAIIPGIPSARWTTSAAAPRPGTGLR